MGAFILGVGICGAFPASGGLSYREMIARAATMAYSDAGLTPDKIDGAVSVEEDFISGYSISDEYTPDQLGMVKKPVYTICGDYLHGLCSAVMQIETGRFNTVVVEGYSKASNILTKDETLHFAYDPVFGRLGVTPHFLAGIEMQSFLKTTRVYKIDDVADVVVRHRSNATRNTNAAYGAVLTGGDVLGARPVAEPVTEAMISRPADAAIVMVIGNAGAAKNSPLPVAIKGAGWTSGNSIIERRTHGISEGTRLAAAMAYKEAGIKDPSKENDLFYVSDIYAHRALMHMEALGLAKSDLPRVNLDGGSLGTGDLFESNGGARLYDAVRMIRAKNGTRAIVHGWRGLPTDSCAVVAIAGERRGS